jgi:hypothetical protein
MTRLVADTPPIVATLFDRDQTLLGDECSRIIPRQHRE